MANSVIDFGVLLSNAARGNADAKYEDQERFTKLQSEKLDVEKKSTELAQQKQESAGLQDLVKSIDPNLDPTTESGMKAQGRFLQKAATIAATAGDGIGFQKYMTELSTLSERMSTEKDRKLGQIRADLELADTYASQVTDDKSFESFKKIIPNLPIDDQTKDWLGTLGKDQIIQIGQASKRFLDGLKVENQTLKAQTDSRAKDEAERHHKATEAIQARNSTTNEAKQKASAAYQEQRIKIERARVALAQGKSNKQDLAEIKEARREVQSNRDNLAKENKENISELNLMENVPDYRREMSPEERKTRITELKDQIRDNDSQVQAMDKLLHDSQNMVDLPSAGGKPIPGKGSTPSKPTKSLDDIFK